MEKASASLMILSNKNKIIEMFWQRLGICSTDPGKFTGLSAPSITRIVDELIGHDQGASYIGIGNFSGGRRPMMVNSIPGIIISLGMTL